MKIRTERILIEESLIEDIFVKNKIRTVDERWNFSNFENIMFRIFSFQFKNPLKAIYKRISFKNKIVSFGFNNMLMQSKLTF